jgi:undecaprenyl-diphosphatase
MTGTHQASPRSVSDALILTHEWFATNSGWAPPDEDTLADWLADGVCRCPDDCLVGPEQWCEHGLASWCLILAQVDSFSMAAVSNTAPPTGPTTAGTSSDPEPHPDLQPAELTDPDVVPAPDPRLTEILKPHVPHVGDHDVAPPHDLSAVDRFDQAVDRAVDRLRGTEPADRIFYSITELADFSLLWLLIATARAAASDKQTSNAVRVGAVLMVESVLVNAAVKSVFKRERPVIQTERPYHLRIPLTTSFPSGHSSAAMVAAILLSENSKVKPLYWGLAGLVASSRVYVRIHHASDVVGGLAVGVVLGSVAKRAWPLDRGPIGTRRLRRHLSH